MDKEKIWTHITRKISGENTLDDSLKVDEWLNDKPENKLIYSRLKEVWNFTPTSEDVNYSLFESIKRRIRVHEHHTKQSFFNTTFFKVAAILAVILASNFLVYQFKKEPIKTELVSWQEIVVPRGNRMKLVLPDSTSIWLNNETKLRYASNFSSSNREVELSGEAYFDVHHDANNPFIVKVGSQRIKVLGTKFSVNAYPEDQMIETSLVSGSVVFQNDREINGNSEFRLDPGYSLFYDKQNNSVVTQKIQSSYYQYWENGVYAFKDENFESLALKIKRIFNVEIVFEDTFLKSKTYTGTININDNIYLFMEAIRRTSVEPIEYKFNKNIIYVKLKSIKKV
jgi:ferric-dicitrate binding protein FerR (iron transport regulator)